MSSHTPMTVGGKKLVLSNLDKVLYPAAQFTKGQVIDYYTKIAPVLLPHLKNRPLTLKRYPNGVDREFFYEKRCPSFRPAWLKTAPIWSEGNQENISYCLANNLASLVWAANLASLELHTSLARGQQPDRPTMLVFDLDPGPGADVTDCAEVGLWLRDILTEHELKCFPKTSGSKGLQIYAPLHTPVTFDQTKDFSHRVADLLAQTHSDKVTSVMAKELRKGKVFIDWSQNDAHKTTVCAYSLRAKERPTVSTPLRWSEVETAAKDRVKLSFEAAEVLQRMESFGDLFAPVLKERQKLPKLT